MKRHHRFIVVAFFLVIAVQYWMLADVSRWLIVDSYALEHFPQKHPIWARVVANIWGADMFVGGRYLVILVLTILCWWFVRPPRKF